MRAPPALSASAPRNGSRDSVSALRRSASSAAAEMSASSAFSDEKGGSASEPEYGHDPASGGIFSSDYKSLSVASIMVTSTATYLFIYIRLC
ncbi:hypothetical protein Q8A67_025030 [Cirrhinus molitorella]|uniref:Uncharacterized protein n=1 Tax=Cirrhinus molitorella TaxID=172907 RepID=A0AA88P7K8_9TELE|nr:hypothetical protein Q8A67_025030 [Cirrhinus molitorella]